MWLHESGTHTSIKNTYTLNLASVGHQTIYFKSAPIKTQKVLVTSEEFCCQSNPIGNKVQGAGATRLARRLLNHS